MREFYSLTHRLYNIERTHCYIFRKCLKCNIVVCCLLYVTGANAAAATAVAANAAASWVLCVLACDILGRKYSGE